jgi:hypothetical protein
MSSGVFSTGVLCFYFHLSRSLAPSPEFYALKSITGIPTSSKLRHPFLAMCEIHGEVKIVNMEVHDQCLSETWPNVTGLRVWVVL